ILSERRPACGGEPVLTQRQQPALHDGWWRTGSNGDRYCRRPISPQGRGGIEFIVVARFHHLVGRHGRASVRPIAIEWREQFFLCACLAIEQPLRCPFCRQQQSRLVKRRWAADPELEWLANGRRYASDYFWQQRLGTDGSTVERNRVQLFRDAIPGKISINRRNRARPRGGRATAALTAGAAQWRHAGGDGRSRRSQLRIAGIHRPVALGCVDASEF